MKLSSSRGSSSTAIGGGYRRSPRTALFAAAPQGVLAERHPKPPPGSVIGPHATVLIAHDELLAKAAARRGGVPACRRGLEGRGPRAAADLHAASHAGGLRDGRAAADDDHPREHRAAARVGG